MRQIWHSSTTALQYQHEALRYLGGARLTDPVSPTYQRYLAADRMRRRRVRMDHRKLGYAVCCVKTIVSHPYQERRQLRP
jgi:hypothetical protein